MIQRNEISILKLVVHTNYTYKKPTKFSAHTFTKMNASEFELSNRGWWKLNVSAYTRFLWPTSHPWWRGRRCRQKRPRLRVRHDSTKRRRIQLRMYVPVVEQRLGAVDLRPKCSPIHKLDSAATPRVAAVHCHWEKGFSMFLQGTQTGV